MKLFQLLSLCCCAFLFSCSNDEYVEITKENVPQSINRTKKEAIEIATKAISWLETTPTRGKSRKISYSDCFTALSHISRSSSTDTIFYVINYDNNEGFAIVNANRSLPEILAVTEKGYYNPNERTGCEPFDEYMSEVISTYRVKPPTIGGETPFNPYYTYTVDTTFISLDIKPKSLCWGQSVIEGKYCPNKVAGCSNVALAIAMAYNKYPTQINLTFPNAPKSSLSLNWDKMIEHNGKYKFNPYCFDGVEDDIHEQIALLCRELGHRNNSNYKIEKEEKNNSTSTSTNNLIKTLSNLGFNSPKVVNLNYFTDIPLHKDFKIALIQASNDSSAHMWIMDGGRIIKKESTTYKVETIYGTKIEKTTRIKYSSSEHYYPHYNWGWDGICNGYFNYLSMDSSLSSDYDNNDLNNTYKYYYNKNKSYIIVEK